MTKTYIEEYYDWICKNPDKVCKKVKTIYSRLVEDIKTPKEVSFFNKSTNETETHTYIFDIVKAHKPINFIERICKIWEENWLF